jgi:DNA-binding transcriptional ArsR family regulator
VKVLAPTRLLADAADVLSPFRDSVVVVGVCERVPLFDISQPTLSHHLTKLRTSGIVDSEHRGLWVYYYMLPNALQEL